MKADIYYHDPVVILDLDDTLYAEADYAASAYAAIADAMHRRDGIETGASMKVMNRAFRIGNNPFDALLDAFPSISHKELFVPMCVEIYRYHTPEISLPDESREFLETLRRYGIKMALVTDGRVVTQWAKIKALGIEEYFDPEHIWISEERGVGKLDMKPWKFFVDSFPEAKAFVAIGDNPAKDFLYPNMLGFTTICLKDRGRNIHKQSHAPSAAHEPMKKCKSLSDIAEVILKLR